MLIEQLYNYNHRLVQTHAVIKGLYCVPVFVLAVLSENTNFHLIVFLLFFIGSTVVARVPLLKLIHLFLLPLTFTAVGCVTLLVSRTDPLQTEAFSFLGLTLDQATYPLAISIFFKSMAIVSVVYFFLLTHSISQIAAMMYACNIPSLFVDLFVLTYKFIHLLTHTATSMLIAQKCRMGYAQGQRKTIQNFALLFSAVFKHAMQQTEQLEIAMASRLGSDEFLFLRPKHVFFKSHLVLPILFNTGLFIAFFIV